MGRLSSIRRAALLYALAAGAIGLLVVLLAGAGSPSPAARAQVEPTPAPADEPPMDPFPTTETMTDTVQAVLDAYNSPSVLPRIEPIQVLSTESLIALPVVVTAAEAAPAPPDPTPTPQPEPKKPADIAITLRPFPNIRVARGGQLEHVIVVNNYGDGEAEGVAVTLPYRSDQMVVIGSQFSDNRDWVSEVTDSRVVVRFGPVAPGAERSATLFFRVNAFLPDNTVLSVRADYAWDDGRGGGEWRSNWAPVLVGGGNDNADWVWVTADRLSGPAGTTFTFFSDRFIPGEGVHLWLNTPTGVAPLDRREIADLFGRVWVDFSSAGLAPGSYQIVLYGARSQLTGVQTFIVQ